MSFTFLKRIKPEPSALVLSPVLVFIHKPTPYCVDCSRNYQPLVIFTGSLSSTAFSPFGSSTSLPTTVTGL